MTSTGASDTRHMPAFVAKRLCGLAAAALSILALAPTSALADHSVGTAGQIAWVRSAASRFVAAELAGNGEAACAVLNRPLRGDVRGRSCAQRMSARFHALLSVPTQRAVIRAQARHIPAAVVIVEGNYATIELHNRLLNGPNRFYWTENCWMLTR